MAALIYLGVVAFAAFVITNASLLREARLNNRYFVLFAVLITAGFVTPSYFAFMLVALVAVFALTAGSPVHRIAAFLFLFPLLPALDFPIRLAGIAIIQMNWSRFLSLLLLIPLLPGALRKHSIVHFPTDKFVIAFFLLNWALGFRGDASITAGLRVGIVLTLDVMAPYYVLSRYLTSANEVRTVLTAFVGALTIAGLVNIFEGVNAWHVFDDLARRVIGFVNSQPTVRAGMLRAYGPLDKPSMSAFALAAGLGMMWAVAPAFRGRRVLIPVGIMSLGLLFTFSRGSWLAAAIVGMGYAVTSNMKQLFRFLALSLVVVVAFSLTEIGDDILGLLPFFGDQGSEAARTVDYRGDLLSTSLRVAHERPLLGSTTFDQHPDMEALRQSSGLLDLVNHYLLLLLTSGYVGVLTFASVFLCTLFELARTSWKAADCDEEQRRLARALFFTLIGLLAAISTTSALARVGLILWCLAAISARVAKGFSAGVVPRTAPTGAVGLSR